MKQLQANFLISAEKLSQCPDYPFAEFPLLGRSNVGKSSFINALANNKKIAKTSNTPGKTRLINFFNFSYLFFVILTIIKNTHYVLPFLYSIISQLL